MEFDVNAYLGAVTRSVTNLERDRKPVRSVTLTRSYDTTPDDLWDAITNPERLPRSFLPIHGELKIGGRYQFEGQAGGTITACTPPEFVSVTWEYGPQTSWVEVRIASEGDGRSRFTLSHICPIDEHWETYGPGAVGVGWDLTIIGFAYHIAGLSTDHFKDESWMLSAETKAFIFGASEDWSRAAIAAGDNPAHAEAAARRTAGFYTGEEL
ncbi:SRPBCC family protein [soil metagenome]